MGWGWGRGGWTNHCQNLQEGHLSIINIQHIPLQDSQHPPRELGVQHRTGSVIDLAWDPEDSQEVLELLLQGEA